MDFDAFFAELSQRLSDCTKQGYVPSGRFVDAILDIMPDADTEFCTEEIVPRMPQYGLQIVTVEGEDYIPAGTPEDELGRRLVEVIRKKGYDPEEIYAQGGDRLLKNNRELFDVLCNITFFAVPGCAIGMSSIQNTWRILRVALKAEHQRLHPEKAADEEPWVDEETIEFLQPYVRFGYVPGWVVDKAMQLLVIDLGHYPLSEDVLVTTMQAIGAVSMPIAREYWLPRGTDEAMIRMNLQRILRDSKVDIERACREGVNSINQDIVVICRNMVLFALDSLESLDDASGRTGQLLMQVLMEERQRFHADALDDDESYEPDEEAAQELRTYAKGGLVPSWVVLEQYQRLLDKHHDIAVAGGIRDATMQKVGVTSMRLDKENYIAPGTSQDDMDEHMAEVIQRWDLEKCYGSDTILPEYDLDFQQTVAALFFADPDFDTPEEARDYFMDDLMAAMTAYRMKYHPDDVPKAGLVVLRNALEPYMKDGVCPTFAVENAVRCIVPYVERRWYAERLIWSLVEEQLDIECWTLPEECYVEPGLDEDTRSTRLAEVLRKLNFDFQYIIDNDQYSEEDEDKLDIFADAIYFADDNVDSYDDALDLAKTCIDMATGRYE